MSNDVRPPDDHEELVPEDDAIIGRAFRLSVVVIVAILVVVLAGLWLARDDEVPEEIVAKEVGAVADLDQPVDAVPDVRFTEVTDAAGIRFRHVNGARGDKLLPETMGGGAAFLDYDGDGDQDLLLVNSDWWPGDAPRGERARHALYRNDGSGRFEDVTAASGLDESFYGMGAAVGDYDGDGDPDLYVTALGPNRLYRNDGGRFEDVTAATGAAGGDDVWSASAGFVDYDGDGDLDLFVTNYVRWSRAIDMALAFSLNGTDRAYGPPTNYEGTHSTLFRNDDGRFTDVTAAAGIEVNNPATGKPMGKGLAVTFADFDRDGLIDVFVANDTVQNFLFRNLGDGTFDEVGATAGVGFDGAGNATGAMGVDAAHYRNDAQVAIGIGNFANEMSSLYVAQRGLQFTDEAAGEGVGAPSRKFLSFGLFFFDYDLDGRLDLLQANGHLETEISEVQASQSYRQPAQLFWNAGPAARSCFVEVPAGATGDLAEPMVGRGATYADVDGDGDLDVVLTEVGGPPRLLRNDQSLDHAWLRLRLVGRQANRDAIGAWVEVTAGGRTLRRQVMPTRSYLSQVELPLTFGLGDAGAVESIRVLWPDGTEQQVDPAGVPLGTTTTIVQS